MKGTPYGEKTSKLYNESVFLLSLNTICTVLAAPPKDFEKIIRHYYQVNGASIVKQAALYLAESQQDNAQLFIKEPTLGFKKALATILPKLRKVVEDNQATFVAKE